jgi:hypothetical protein
VDDSEFRDWPDAALRTAIVCSLDDLRYGQKLIAALEASGTTDMLAPDSLPILTGTSTEGWRRVLEEADVCLVLVTRRGLPAEIDTALREIADRVEWTETKLVPIFVEAVHEEDRSILDIQERFSVLRFQALPGDLPIEQWPIPELAWRAVAVGLRDLLWLGFDRRLIQVAERRHLDEESLPEPHDLLHNLRRFEAYGRLPRHPLHVAYPFKRWRWTIDRRWPLWMLFCAILFWILAPASPFASVASAAQAAGLALAASVSLGAFAAIRERSLLRVNPEPGKLFVSQLLDGTLREDEDSDRIRRRVTRTAAAAAAVGVFATLLHAGFASRWAGAALPTGAGAGLVAYVTTLRRIPKSYRPPPAPSPDSNLVRRRGFTLEIVTSEQARGASALPIRPSAHVPYPVIERERLVLAVGPWLLVRVLVEATLILAAGAVVAWALSSQGVSVVFALQGGALVVGMALASFTERLASRCLFPSWAAYLRSMIIRLLLRGAALGLLGLATALIAAILARMLFGKIDPGPIFGIICLLLVVVHRLWVTLTLTIQSERGPEDRGDVRD